MTIQEVKAELKKLINDSRPHVVKLKVIELIMKIEEGEKSK